MHDTLTYVYATAGQAKRIQDDLTKKAFPVKKGTGRPTKAVAAASLPTILPKSWLLLVLVSDDADVATVAAWAQGKDQSRVHFYFAPGTDTHIGMKPWASHDLPAPGDVDYYAQVPGFRRDVGIKINERIDIDFG